ncbi:ArnT family glycosyltransferase [Roseivirga thermotolerans]|uniref:ArnT family glycosyltransferase n=1 Tax=Roseivirga thermotolerans TaxID=1758176 RepID=UPI00273D3386|nr:glycosyltransferase family 39 protein [Roseivirga thermotolerans]
MTTSTLSRSTDTKPVFAVFLIIWFIVGLIQNYFTEVSGEEAYYWLFSQYLDWGYLDHPPMVGVLSYMGYTLIPNALGLRLWFLIANMLTLVVIRKTLAKKDDPLFVWIALSAVAVHAGAFLVKTDVPLILFEALFLYFYKQYLEDDNWKVSVLLALSIALIMLSKHHGFLIVIFTVLSNLKLVLRKSFWLVVLATVVFMIPHTIWQFNHDFATIKFHLYNRIDMGFSWESLAYYVGIQPVVFGPFCGVLLIAGAFLNRHGSDFNRALRFCLVGVFVFFFISTLKVEFHKHWTSIMMMPLVLLAHEYIADHERMRRWMKRIAVATLVLIVPLRIYLMYDFLPKSWTEGWDVLHNWDTWAEEVNELSNGLPIMFNNHYERASRYAYLTGDIVHCYNTFDYRETQHDLLPLEEQLQGKTVFQINRYRDTVNYKDYYTQIGKGIHYRVVENFRSFRKVAVELIDEEQVNDLKKGNVMVTLRLINHYDYAVNFSDAGERRVVLNAHYLKGLQPVGIQELKELSGEIAPGESREVSVLLQQPQLGEGKHHLRFSIQVEGIEPPINSKKYELEMD